MVQLGWTPLSFVLTTVCKVRAFILVAHVRRRGLERTNKPHKSKSEDFSHSSQLQLASCSAWCVLQGKCKQEDLAERGVQGSSRATGTWEL